MNLEKVLGAEGVMVLMKGGNRPSIGKESCKALVEAMPFYPDGEGRPATPRQDGDGQTVSRKIGIQGERWHRDEGDGHTKKGSDE